MSSVDTAGLINRKDGDINEYTASINQDIIAIKGIMQIDKSNGVDGLSVSSMDLLDIDGLINPDANFFDIYYDESGKPYFLFNQYNPLFGYFQGRNDKEAHVNACSYCSHANAFILSHGVHSVVDSFGIYMFTLSYGQKNGEPIRGENWLEVMKGDPTKGKMTDDYFPFVKKYMYDDKGDLIFKPDSDVNSKQTLLDGIANDEETVSVVFQGGCAIKKDRQMLEQVVREAEENGYEVEINCANSGASAYGSNHYICVHYDTKGGVKVADSFANRSTRADRNEGTVLQWDPKGREQTFPETTGFSTTSDKHFSRETSVIWDAGFKGADGLKEFFNKAETRGSGEPVYIKITKKQ